jgi:hypothetical protein
MTIQEILASGNKRKIKALFQFSLAETDEEILLKFNIFARFMFPKYFSSEDADFHETIDQNNLHTYRGTWHAFVDIAFRGAAKTARTKLFVAFCVINDTEHFRRYVKVLSADGENSKQIVTDIYNMLVHPQVVAIYPEIFEKTSAKHEETMSSFTTTTGIKMIADTVGTDQRGALQEDARPDWLWYEDFENRKTLRSARVTRAIWDNMEEARTGLAKGGSCIYSCNYISEQANVHTLVLKYKEYCLIVPIMDELGEPTWPSRYTIGDINQMKIDDDDFEGERMCKPSHSKEIMFDREMLDRMPAIAPQRVTGGFKLFKAYDPSHRYGGGHDVAGGVGLDSSTSVFIDFQPVPAQVVATFKSNEIAPDTFGDEIRREQEMFGDCVVAPEKNNHGHATIARLRQLDANLYLTKGKDDKIFVQGPKEYGWHTNALTKPKMIFALVKAVNDGLIELNDPDLISEAKSYTRNDLIDTENDPRLVPSTRHFDLLTAACIAWQMKDVVQIALPDPSVLAARYAERKRNLLKNTR